ncbi:tRNA (N6-threonylcarbamoyladenosine(37)-N6)-methyltransferase TrmO [Methanocella sp. CWC-04]|uniref:tRNA (N6-threonylcarbamoyladenosine(37)-N6)-methyltransferase TrmO n=1 Tax=Methanooceanicella nereidis TaxID=2052831 RepID=A0AAP2W4H7_9EURY|nr:tRNA (N6-threonylcarbamoyladenosine(37)-N6)-methyltransferase TrmO [Methanocella sp. CWC-04]MCD1294285.1 tRNA (N6-threonylcarbamoyladenosine(37)-N6)-methyltransferase TrmO [Methanocella sp. CWC-04]
MSHMYDEIGVIHSEFKEKEKTPVQSAFSKAWGTVEVFPGYADGLKDIEGFSHIFLLYHFDRADGSAISEKPIVDAKGEHGVFAMRHFNRPNPIGLSIVELKGVRGNILDVCGLDILDGTPLLDIKPYIRHFDVMEGIRNGWVDEQHMGAIRDKSVKPA